MSPEDISEKFGKSQVQKTVLEMFYKNVWPWGLVLNNN